MLGTTVDMFFQKHLTVKTQKGREPVQTSSMCPTLSSEKRGKSSIVVISHIRLLLLTRHRRPKERIELKEREIKKVIRVCKNTTVNIDKNCKILNFHVTLFSQGYIYIHMILFLRLSIPFAFCLEE